MAVSRKGSGFSETVDRVVRGGSWAFQAGDLPAAFRLGLRAGDRGRIRNTDNHYLTFEGSGRPFVKGGADIPENLLGYEAIRKLVKN